MYVRETLTRRTANKTYRSVRLVESRRVGRKVQQKTLLNLGASFRLANRNSTDRSGLCFKSRNYSGTLAPINWRIFSIFINSL